MQEHPECSSLLRPRSSPRRSDWLSSSLACGILIAGLLGGSAVFASASDAAAAPDKSGHTSTWPQGYAVARDEPKGTLTLSTPYYTVEQDLRKGGAISRISLRHGKAPNLLVRPVETFVLDQAGAQLTDLRDRAPQITHRRDGLNEIVQVDSALVDEKGIAAGLRVKSTLTYRWGYIKIHKEFVVPKGGMLVKELSPFSTILAPSLSDYGYREGLAEDDRAPAFSFGSNRWGKIRLDQPSDPAVQTRYVPRSMLFADAGVEGLEWFVSSNLSPWELQFAGRRGQGRFRLDRSLNPAGLAVSVSPIWTNDAAVSLRGDFVLDYYLAVPILEGHAQRPWLHRSFNRNQGNWLSADNIRQLAEKGIQTVHCHNDGDYYGDGLFWRDGSYPPYPDMDRYDKVLRDCRQAGIRSATYFSNKELHSSTKEFQEHGDTWGRKNRKGDLRHNFFRQKSEFGVQMCLRSGWLEFLKLSIDRVLKNHPLDGVYYDWNVALFCCNPRHEADHDGKSPARGHWDIDELLDLMEWTRNRVGRQGLIIVHNTTTPMFATENFADYVVATEWGYKKWTEGAPSPQDLPLEWSLVGARSRGVISYGVLDGKSPTRLHRLFALEAFLGGVSPWPASEQTFELLPLLKPLGDIESYRFADWRNSAVALSDNRCASAIYSRPGESFLLLANLDQAPRTVTCVLRPDRLPHPLDRVTVARKLVVGAAGEDKKSDQQTAVNLDQERLTGEGIKIEIPADDAVFVQVRQ